MGHHRLTTPDIGRIFRGETVSGLSEWQLLERYLERRDEIAFEALVARHGPMVLGVCRRMLTDHRDVEDAFQATFLVLVRRARQLGPRDAIGPWLYGVAARVALRARSEAARRRRLEPIAGDVPAAACDAAVVDRELREVLDQELSRLPSKYRFPLILCYLEGQTHEEAARQLAWPVGTVKGRLARARDLLRSRLARRGLTTTASALTLVLARESTAALHRELLDRTVKSSLKLAMGQAASQVVSTSIASLVEGVLTSMMLTKLKWAGAAVLLSGLALTGAGVMAQQAGKQHHDEQTATLPESDSTAVATAALAAAAPADSASTVSLKEKQAIPKLADLRAQLLQSARIEWATAYKDFRNSNSGLERAYQASRRLKNAEEESLDPSSDKTAPAKSHFERIREMARIQHGSPSSTEVQIAQVKSFEAEGELWLAKAKSIRAEQPTNPGEEAGPQYGAAQPTPHRPVPVSTPGEGRGQDPRSRRILAKLEDLVPMSFLEETPLEEVLKHVKQATASPELADGIPIYVDPIGLQEAEKSMTSTVRNMDLKGVPLRRTLQLLLKQLDLIYFVEDGILCITSGESGDQGLGPCMGEPSPLMEKTGKAERGELTLKEMKDLVEMLKTLKQIEKLQHPDKGAGGLQ